MNMKKWVALLMAAVLAVGMLAACGGGGGGKGDIMVCFSSDPETVDPALNSTVDGSTLIHNAFAGIYGWDKDSAGNPIVVPECAEALVEPTELPDGKFEYVFQLRDGLKWSDGEAMKASDFTYAWNRAVDPKTLADYQAIFGVIDGYDDVNPNLNISADDEANTVTVVTTAYCAYFDELMAFPTFFPVRQDIVEANPDGWATDVASYISNGPFKMSEWTVGSSIKYVKNEHYWNADKVKLDSLTFALSADDDANFVNFKNGTYKFLYNVPQQMIPEFIEERLGTRFFIGEYVGN
ncbi:MAG: ABC transporter substrate-binding protein [Oscillospiraceae bacterium]